MFPVNVNTRFLLQRFTCVYSTWSCLCISGTSEKQGLDRFVWFTYSGCTMSNLRLLANIYVGALLQVKPILIDTISSTQDEFVRVPRFSCSRPLSLWISTSSSPTNQKTSIIRGGDRVLGSWQIAGCSINSSRERVGSNVDLSLWWLIWRGAQPCWFWTRSMNDIILPYLPWLLSFALTLILYWCVSICFYIMCIHCIVKETLLWALERCSASFQLHM